MWSALESELEISRKKILAAISGVSEFALIRGYGNIGDDLIYAGTRQLLPGLRYRELSILKLDGVRGELAVVTGGGAWCKPFEDMARNFPEVEKRFERVIVLPSSFDLESPLVAGTLSRTKALVFARERVSYEQIRSVCRADLAHDCAFFFNYAPYRQDGSGKLNAFRTDAEATVVGVLPPDNNDISRTCDTLDEWLWTIARHEIVQTDRAHVMIAAVMLGKRVAYRSSNYHKVTAIADYSLGALPAGVVESLDANHPRKEILEEARKTLGKLPLNFERRHRGQEVTVVILSYNRLELTRMAVKALRENVTVPFRLLVVDNNSEPDVRAALRELQTDEPRLEILFLDENLGCAGGRSFAFQHVSTPYVLLLDNDVEILPGALEHLLAQFDAHPDAVAVTGRVVFPDGTTHLCGAEHHIEDDVLYFGMMSGGCRFDEIPGKSGECGWVPGCLTLVRTRHLRLHPYDLQMRSYYEDLDWCLGIEKQRAGKFYRSLEAIGIHYHEEKMPAAWIPIAERLPRIVRFLETLSYFHKKHGVVVEALFRFVPELGSSRNPVSISAAKLLLAMIDHPGSDWVAQKWMSGALSPLFVVTSDYERSLYNEVEFLRRRYDSFASTRSWKLVILYWRLKQAWRSLTTKLSRLTRKEA